MKDKLELRFSLGYQKQIRNVGIHSFSVGLGLNKYLLRFNKLLIYAGTELSYEKFSLLPALISTDPSTTIMSSIDNIAVVNVAVLAGLEYQFNSTLSMFLEPELVQFSVLEESSDIEPVLSYLKLIDGTQFGVKYRF